MREHTPQHLDYPTFAAVVWGLEQAIRQTRMSEKGTMRRAALWRNRWCWPDGRRPEARTMQVGARSRMRGTASALAGPRAKELSNGPPCGFDKDQMSNVEIRPQWPPRLAQAGGLGMRGAFIYVGARDISMENSRAFFLRLAGFDTKGRNTKLLALRFYRSDRPAEALGYHIISFCSQ